MWSRRAAVTTLAHRAGSGTTNAPPRLVLVGVCEDAGDRLRVGCVVVARRVGDEPLELGPASVVPEREEAEDDDRQDVPLVVGRLDRPAEPDRRLPQLAEQVLERPAVPVFGRCGLLLPGHAVLPRQ